MKKHIVSIGGYSLGDEIEEISFRSKRSLFDADIVMFCPSLSEFQYDNMFRGRMTFDETDSFEIADLTAHWQRELKGALGARKTVFFFTNDINSFWLQLGEQHLGKKLVKSYDPYSVLPVDFGEATRAAGQRIQPVGDLGVLKNYWRQFSPYSSYFVYFDKPFGKTYLLTQSGSKVVGCGGPMASGGHLFILPLPNLESMVTDRLASAPKNVAKNPQTRENSAKKSGPKRQSANRSVSQQFASVLLEIDSALQTATSTQIIPHWANAEAFTLREERQLEKHLDSLIEKINRLEQEKSATRMRLEEAGTLKNLLYGSGVALEKAILEALRILGFEVRQVREGNSEFDVVFSLPGGPRLIGEAEGKDTKAIGIEKLDQLERNIREEFALQSSSDFAKGVLFGNAFRLLEPTKRPEFFSEKCRFSAARTSVALVRTTDLFTVVKYVADTKDDIFAIRCCKAITDANGTIAEFPKVPPKGTLS